MLRLRVLLLPLHNYVHLQVFPRMFLPVHPHNVHHHCHHRDPLGLQEWCLVHFLVHLLARHHKVHHHQVFPRMLLLIHLHKVHHHHQALFRVLLLTRHHKVHRQVFPRMFLPVHLRHPQT